MALPLRYPTVLTLMLILVTIVVTISCKQSPEDPSGKMIEKLIRQMTLEEKAGQLTLTASSVKADGQFTPDNLLEEIRAGRVGALLNVYGPASLRKLQETAIRESRLKIPLLFGYDVIHGFRVIFPIPLAEAASWDLEAIEQSARYAAMEATAFGLHWTFAPMCDIARDPRWGRIAEGAGEDPYLASLIATARVKGFQGDNLSHPATMAACAKHFAAYGAPLAGRDYHSVDMSEYLLREVYLPPFQAAVKAGVASIMTAFNDLNGIPCTANPFLLKQILRNEWQFKGFIVSDWTSVEELIPHGFAENPPHAAQLAFQAGLDMDMQSGLFIKHLPDLVKEGIIQEQEVNEAVRRILRLKYQLGLFDDPFRYGLEDPDSLARLTETIKTAAREMARKSFVLLKNHHQLLPLRDDFRRIALIGPLAHTRKELPGCWAAAADTTMVVTLLEGLKNRYPDREILYTAGCDIHLPDTTGFAAAYRMASKADVVILALGEAAWMTGEAASRSNPVLPEVQQQLAKAIHSTGKPLIVVLFAGRPLVIPWLAENADAILLAWFPGTMGGAALADVISGDYNPSGKLPVTFPRSVGQIPIFYSQKNTGRPFDPENLFTSRYIDLPNDPLYVFGHGLSYTTFQYSNLLIDRSAISPADSAIVSVNVTNTGQFAGEETVQLYIHDKVASVTRPVKELKGFRKIFLRPGESVEVKFTIKPDDLAFYRQDGTYGWEPGEFSIYVGGSADANLNVSFKLHR